MRVTEAMSEFATAFEMYFPVWAFTSLMKPVRTRQASGVSFAAR